MAADNYLEILSDMGLSASAQQAKLESLAGELGIPEPEVMAEFAASSLPLT